MTIATDNSIASMSPPWSRGTTVVLMGGGWGPR